jgi:hypothetical protein
MDNSQQYTVSRVSTKVSLKDSYYRGTQPQSDIFFPSVVRPTYFLDYEDRYYYASDYSSFGIFGSVVSFDLLKGASKKRLMFYLSDGNSGFNLSGVYKAKVKPLSSLQALVFYTLNALRYFFSPFVEVVRFVGRLLDLQAIMILVLLTACSFFVHEYVGVIPYVDYALYTLMGVEVFLSLLNKSHWVNAIYHFRYYLERRSRVFYESALSLGTVLNLTQLPSALPQSSLDLSYEKVILLSIASLEHDLFRWIQLKDDTRDLTRREIAELFSNLEGALGKLDISDWGIIERILERCVRGKDSFLIPELITSWGVDSEKEPALFYLCVSNLRTLAGYKDVPFKVNKTKDK